jgi:Flp pilus assembly protein TadD
MNEPLKKSLVKWLLCALLAVVTLAVYAPVAENPFINLDDPDYVINNLHVRQGLTADTVHWAWDTFHSTNWHPLTWLSHALDCQLYGVNPMGHHLTNVVWHVLNTVLLFLLLQNLTARRWPSVWVALLFALHPLHVESVAWVSERKDVLSGFFFLLTLLAYARYVELVKIHRCRGGLMYGLTLLFFAFGLMSKPMLVTVPCVLLLLDYWPLGRFSFFEFRLPLWRRLVLEKIPFFLLTALSCWVTILAQAGALKPAANFPLAARLAHVPVAYVWYVFKLVWPVDHSIYYMLHVHPSAGAVIGALLLLGGATVLLVWLARHHPVFIFGWLWFLVMLVPVIGFIQAGDQAYAERYTYLPYIGLFILIAWGIPALLARGPWSKILLWSAAILASVACCQLTIAQIRIWQSAETLFKQAVDEDPGNERAWIFYGLQFNHAWKPDRAIECLRQAIAINPESEEAWNDLGRILIFKGKYDEARSAFETALAGGQPWKPVIYRNLADLMMITGKTNEAIVNLESSLEFEPDQPEAALLLGNLYLADHQREKAADQFEQVIRLLGNNAEAEMGLAVIAGDAGRNAEAIAHYRRVVALDANSVYARNNLAWLLATDADPGLRNGGEAVRLAEQACQLTRYDQAFYIGTLAAAYAEAGKFAAAVKTAQKARDVALAHGQKDVAANNERLLGIYQTGHAFHGEPRPAP